MIFATVGTQLPFDRLVEALTDLAPSLDEDIIVQTGTAARAPDNLDCRAQLSPSEFEAIFTAARVVVSHAGVGTILSARRWGKPLVIMPRRHALGEHRNDHQVATAQQVQRLEGIYVAWDATDLPGLLQGRELSPASDEPTPARQLLLDRLRKFVVAG